MASRISTQQDLKDVDYEFMESFQIFDTEGTGKIRQADLMFIMKKLNLTVSEKTIQEMIKAADIDGDGTNRLRWYVLLYLHCLHFQIRPEQERQDIALLHYKYYRLWQSSWRFLSRLCTKYLSKAPEM